jgi:hypothetical protein
MPPTPPPSADRRAAYAAELAQGTDRFHEPRREDCPWCGSKRLRTRLRTPDQVQRKPGTFVVDECAECSHAFQNPRLSAEGLAFYHRDFHEGLDGLTDRLLGARGSRGRYRAAARALLRHAEPESWLDVGTGHGHFPAVAREVHPYTSFDGSTPPGGSRRRGRPGIEEAHRGRLTDPRIIGRLSARYDVVSMFHHLEHTRDPREELRAALGPAAGRSPPRRSAGPRLRVRRAAGQVVGVVRPAAPLHLMPLSNLLGELESLGCEIVATDRREPHIPYDLAGALALALGRVLPDLDAPWRPTPPTQFQRALHTVLARASVPLLASASALDHAMAPVFRRTRFSNAFRIIARRKS